MKTYVAFMNISKRLAMLKAKSRSILSYQVSDGVTKDLSYLYGDSLKDAIKENMIESIYLQDGKGWYKISK
jgi:hypothetical protein